MYVLLLGSDIGHIRVSARLEESVQSRLKICLSTLLNMPRAVIFNLLKHIGHTEGVDSPSAIIIVSKNALLVH